MIQAALPMVYHVRHGDTAWTLTAQHTGRTDLPLNEQGERQARELGASLTALRIDRIRSSPLQRARRTVELALSPGVVAPDRDPMECDRRIVQHSHFPMAPWTLVRANDKPRKGSDWDVIWVVTSHY